MNKELIYYPGGKNRALTFSYDDGQRVGDEILVDMFNRYNVKGTFHLNSSKMTGESCISQDEAKTLYKGHEIACHSATHPFLETLPKTLIAEEIMNDRRKLEKTAGYIVRGFSYPFGTYNDELASSLQSYGIEYARTIKSTRSFFLPHNFMKWHPTCHHSEGIEALLDTFVSKQFMNLSVFYIWGHSFEFVNNNNFDVMERFLKKAANRDDIWYATNIEIYDYVTAVRSLKFSVDKKIIYNPTNITVCAKADGQFIDIHSGYTYL